MRRAVYYPHTAVEDPMLVKSSLLLWDKLECIVPWKQYNHQYRGEIADAMTIIGEERYPTDEEKEEAHIHLEEIFTRKLPPEFFYDETSRATVDDYEIYPQKLWEKTWQMLEDLRVSRRVPDHPDRLMKQAGGLTVMSVIADCCAGTTRSRVTDRGAAYANLAKVLTAAVDEKAPVGAEDVLVPITLEVIDFSTVDLSKLIAFRDKENGRDGLAYRDLRYRYVDGLEKYVKELTTTKGRASDIRQVRENFENDMRIDLQNLEGELRSAKRDVAFSKDVIVTAVAGIGTIASAAIATVVPLAGVVTAAGLPATLAGAAGVANKYYAARKAIMQKHPMAYMYQLAHS